MVDAGLGGSGGRSCAGSGLLEPTLSFSDPGGLWSRRGSGCLAVRLESSAYLFVLVAGGPAARWRPDHNIKGGIRSRLMMAIHVGGRLADNG